jgi:hypothetical protein
MKPTSIARGYPRVDPKTHAREVFRDPGALRVWLTPAAR